MSTKEQYWKYSLITIIIGLGIILARQITPFLGGLLGKDFQEKGISVFNI